MQDISLITGEDITRAQTSNISDPKTWCPYQDMSTAVMYMCTAVMYTCTAVMYMCTAVMYMCADTPFTTHPHSPHTQLTYHPAPICTRPWTSLQGTLCSWYADQTTPTAEVHMTLLPLPAEAHTSEEGLFSHSTLARSSPLVVLSMACSNTSTF